MKTTVPLLALTLLLGTAASAQTMTPGAHFLQNWDQDGDGIVTLDEAMTKRNDLFTAFDADEDGKLSAEEYSAFDEMRSADQEMMREEMGAGMGQGGGKGHGMGMGHGKGMPEEGGMMRGFNDADGDGMVSREEFTSRTADWLAIMDRDGDGQVTAADFGR
ncbi:EF-hand domain-containing protein [Tabrizicola fusiformis]|uniref:EF-hand domain-containing protein n=1 Tax=Tabrizicola sp. SY72 TaxID=2741673 RepID=UPI001573E987|nr:EF-hand domain-containing protein [Tabrizicola sp. SY72]NTT86129.1 EF-hand domain-containing protein [Tabrizicola sp. SY72]